MGTKSIEISEETYSRLRGLARSGESFSDVIERVGLHSEPRLTWIQRFCVVIWGYCVVIWLYVIAIQLIQPDLVYTPLTLWLPVRLDYLGEAAFVLSFVFALIAVSHPRAKR